MAVASDYKSVDNLNTEGIKGVHFVDDIIWHVGEPSEALLITLLGGKSYAKDSGGKPKEVTGKIKKSVTDQYDFKIAEKDPLARTVTVAAAVADTTTTTVVLSSNSNCRVNDTMYNKNTGEFVLVYAVDSGGANLSVRRNLGSTSYTIGANDVFTIVGDAFTESGSKASLKSQLAATRTGSCQIFKRAFGLSKRAVETGLFLKDVNSWDEETTQAMVEHKKDLNFSFWMNPSSGSTTDASSNTVNYTFGLLETLSAYTTTLDSPITEDEFFGIYGEKMFEYGPRRKTAFVDAAFWSMINQWSRIKNTTKTVENKFGAKVTELELGHGVLDIMVDGTFTKFLPATSRGLCAVLDTERLEYLHYRNRDTRIIEGIETPGDDVKESQYLTDAGLIVKTLPHHYIIKNAA